MLTGKLPYADIDDLDALKSAMCSLQQVSLPKEANKLPKGFKKALGAMLQVDPELRPSIEQVLILIKESDFKLNNLKKTSKLPLPPPSTPKPTPISNQLDENTRITLALFMVNISQRIFYLIIVDLYQCDPDISDYSIF